jgi:hypothetical protein
MDQHRPGDFVSRSGIYFALHREHRAVNELALAKGDLFPQCRICGARVTFQFWRTKAVAAAAVLPAILVPYCYAVLSSFEGLAI